MLARVMLLAIDIILAGEPLGLETTCDLGRELRHAYPELIDVGMFTSDLESVADVG